MSAARLFLVIGLLLCAGCAHVAVPSPAVVSDDPKTLPAGSMRDLVLYGQALVEHTRAHLRPYVTANMDCAACHIAAGRKPRGGSLVGVYAQFPQWNRRAHRVIALQDRLAECFLYSMNGRPPAYQSREMEALIAYIAFLSRGVRVGATPEPAVRIPALSPPAAPSAPRGAAIYAQRCSSCHAAEGSGKNGAFPPLWGSRSFNDGAGMHRLPLMAGFVRFNMPANAPGTLSAQQAYDVSAYVLSHARPRFDRARSVAFPPQPAGYF